MTPETFKFMWRCILGYSVVLSIAVFTIGFIVGCLVVIPSRAPARHNYPAQMEPDNSSLDTSRPA